MDERPFSSEQLLPLVYDELRRLAAQRLAREGGQLGPMQPTSLVHATYLRLIQSAAQDQMAWEGRAHFFGAAALAMRRILVERARERGQIKRGGTHQRVELDLLEVQAESRAGAGAVDMLALDLALTELELAGPELYAVVMLRYFAGLSVEETAGTLGISPRTAKRRWAVARLWLLDRMEGRTGTAPDG